MSADERQDDFLISMGRSEQVFCLWNTDCVDEARERQAAGGAVRDMGVSPSSSSSVHMIGSIDEGAQSEFAQKGRRRGKLGLLSWLSEAKEPSKLSAEMPNASLPQRLTLKHVYG